MSYPEPDLRVILGGRRGDRGSRTSGQGFVEVCHAPPQPPPRLCNVDVDRPLPWSDNKLSIHVQYLQP
eukprot:6546698-Pyramimonas_sp.AAC.1